MRLFNPYASPKPADWSRWRPNERSSWKRRNWIPYAGAKPRSFEQRGAARAYRMARDRGRHQNPRFVFRGMGDVLARRRGAPMAYPVGRNPRRGKRSRRYAPRFGRVERARWAFEKRLSAHGGVLARRERRRRAEFWDWQRGKRRNPRYPFVDRVEYFARAREKSRDERVRAIERRWTEEQKRATTGRMAAVGYARNPYMAPELARYVKERRRPARFAFSDWDEMHGRARRRSRYRTWRKHLGYQNPKRDGSPTRGEKRQAHYRDHLRSIRERGERARLELNRLQGRHQGAPVLVAEKTETQLAHPPHYAEADPAVIARVERINARMADIRDQIREIGKADEDSVEVERLSDELVNLGKERKALMPKAGNPPRPRKTRARIEIARRRRRRR